MNKWSENLFEIIITVSLKSMVRASIDVLMHESVMSGVTTNASILPWFALLFNWTLTGKMTECGTHGASAPYLEGFFFASHLTSHLEIHMWEHLETRFENQKWEIGWAVSTVERWLRRFRQTVFMICHVGAYLAQGVNNWNPKQRHVARQPSSDWR